MEWKVKIYVAGCGETVQRDGRGGRRGVPADELHQSPTGAAGGDPPGGSQLPPACRGYPGVGGGALQCPLQPGQTHPPTDCLAGDDEEQHDDPPDLLSPPEIHRPDLPASTGGQPGQHRAGSGLQRVEHPHSG